MLGRWWWIFVACCSWYQKLLHNEKRWRFSNTPSLNSTYICIWAAHIILNLDRDHGLKLDSNTSIKGLGGSPWNSGYKRKPLYVKHHWYKSETMEKQWWKQWCMFQSCMRRRATQLFQRCFMFEAFTTPYRRTLFWKVNKQGSKML